MFAEAPDVGTQLGQQRTDNSRQDVTAACRGDPGRALGLAVEVLEGEATRVVAPLSSTVASVRPAARRTALSVDASTAERSNAAPRR